MIKVIFFDAFGTLCEICNKRNPYKPILKAWPTGVASAYQHLMTRNIPPGRLALEAGCSQECARQVEQSVQAEITSMRLYPEVPYVLSSLRKRGLKWAIVSNLATPYADPLLKLLPFTPDACVWSFDVGFRKPEECIYYHACTMLEVTPAEVLMVGDSRENDYIAPKALGMQARYLKRSGKEHNATDCIENLLEVLM